MKLNKVAIITLVYREPHVFETIKSWKDLMPDVPVYIFADGYDEDTLAQLTWLSESDYAKVIFSDTRKGYPNAARDAMKYMYKNHFGDYAEILFVDSDDCYSAEEIKRMINLPHKEGMDICGYRTNRKEDWYRMPYIKSERILMRFLFCFKMEDYTCAFRRMDITRMYTTILQSKYSQYGFWMEFDAIYHNYFGNNWDETPVKYTPQPTKIFPLKKMPRILMTEFIAILRTRWNL